MPRPPAHQASSGKPGKHWHLPSQAVHWRKELANPWNDCGDRAMQRAWIVAALLAAVWWLSVPPGAEAQQSGRANWIWYSEGDPAKDAPKGTVYFRRVFTINRPVQKPVDEGVLDITADGEFTVWVNGVEVGKGSDWKRVKSFDVMKLLVH